MFVSVQLNSALGGDLHRHCIAYDSDEPASSRSEREVVYLLRQILEGVKHLHDQDFVHLDIKVRICYEFYSVWFVYMFVWLLFSQGCRYGRRRRQTEMCVFVRNKFNQFAQGRALFTQ